MCGIVGIVSAYTNGFSAPEADAFERMLFMDTFRGWDSTGVFGVDNYGNIGILKEASMAPIFMQSKEFKEWRSRLVSNGIFAVGHNRAATRGTIKDENAHPFWVEDNIVLVQNGTYYGDHKHLKNTEVDSEAIAHVIHEEDSVEKAMQRINSAYALVWYNVKEKSLNLLRNDQRPLFVAYTASGAFLFASEAETLNYAIQKSGWKVKSEPYMLKEDNLLKLTLTEKGGCTSENITIPPKKSFSVVRHVSLVDTSDEIGGNWRKYRSRYEPSSLTHSPPVGMNSPTAISQQFFDVFPGNNTEYFFTEEESKSLHQIYLDETKTKRRVIVEAQDYFPANASSHCKVWHILATILAPTPSALDKVAIHWCVYDMDEADVYKYITGVTWFEVTLNGLILSKHGDKYIARVYGQNATELKDPQNETQN